MDWRGGTIASFLSPAAAAGWLAHSRHLLSGLALGLTVCLGIPFLAKFFFTTAQRLGTKVIAAFGMVASTSLFGWMMGSSHNMPSLSQLWAVALVMAYGAGLWFVLDAHPALRRPVGITALVGPALAAGSMLLSWSFDSIAGIPADAISLTWPEQVWMAWPVAKQAMLVMFILFSGYGWFRYFGFWASARVLWRVMSPLLILIYLLTAVMSGLRETQDQAAAATAMLQKGESPSGVLGSKIHWVCATPLEKGILASYGGPPLSFASPVAHVSTTDDRIWLWDPQAAGVSHQAVGYPKDSLMLKWVPSGKSRCHR